MTALPSWLSSGCGGTPLVFLHGMGSTASVWLPQLEHFGRSRLSVAWTMPGYGGSPAPQPLSWAALAESLNTVLAAMGIDKAHVLGHSIGGMVAQEFYHRYPQRVSSLILSATSAAFGSADRQWKEDFLQQRTDALSGFGSFGDAAPVLLDALMGEQTAPALRQLAVLSAQSIKIDRYISSMRLLISFDRRADLENIAVPALLLAGEHDTQAPPKGMQRMANRIPDAQFQMLAGLRHMANVESPHTFNQAVAQFLAAQTDTFAP